MNKFIILCSIIGLFFTVNGQDSTGTKEYKLQSFTELEVMGNFEIKVIHSKQNKAVIDKIGDQAELENIEFIYTDNHLYIKYKGSFVKNIDLDITIYTPHLLKFVKARRGSIIRMDYKSEAVNKIDFEAENGGKIKADHLQSEEVSANISKGGSIQLTGTANQLDTKVAMGGTIGVVNLATKEVKAKVTMGGEVICAPLQTLDAKVTSGGTISYKGNPKVKQKISLGGTIEKL